MMCLVSQTSSIRIKATIYGFENIDGALTYWNRLECQSRILYDIGTYTGTIKRRNKYRRVHLHKLPGSSSRQANPGFRFSDPKDPGRTVVISSAAAFNFNTQPLRAFGIEGKGNWSCKL
jgi:hypothetical protein